MTDNDDTIPDEDMELHLLREQELRARMDLQEGVVPLVKTDFSSG